MRDQSCFIYSSFMLNIKTSENLVLMTSFIDKYPFNITGNLWDPIEDIDPILLSQFSNIK